MTIAGLNLPLQRLPAPLPVWHGSVDAQRWHAAARGAAQAGGRLLSLWGTDRTQGAATALTVCAAYALPDGLVWLDLPLGDARVRYPDLAGIFPYAGRMQRAAADLLGVEVQGAEDSRPWLNHGAWPEDQFPLRRDAEAAIVRAQPAQDYPFVRVAGDGVHEIPVGPIHAGIIEPGHFRFSIVGEKVLRLEERLGYTHKGIEKRFESLDLRQGARLAGRVSGDSTVAYAWAYAMAAENIAGVTPPDRALWLRALLLERERVANHLGDLGYLGNDVALSFGFAQFWILKEQVLRTNAALFGHRYLMDKIVPGGVAVDISTEGKQLIEQECDMLEKRVRILRGIYEEHAGVQDRFIAAGRVEPKLAA